MVMPMGLAFLFSFSHPELVEGFGTFFFFVFFLLLDQKEAIPTEGSS
mgnify:CR=1 FL=1